MSPVGGKPWSSIAVAAQAPVSPCAHQSTLQGMGKVMLRAASRNTGASKPVRSSFLAVSASSAMMAGFFAWRDKGAQRLSIGSRLRARRAKTRQRNCGRVACRASAAGHGGQGMIDSANEDVDVVVIGAGIGGLACAGLLARAGRRVLVCESHSVPGGVAHAFSRSGYEFDSGPSLLSGCSTPQSPSPLRHVLNAIGEDCEWVNYGGWRMITPKGNFDFEVGDAASWEAIVTRFGGPGAVEEWRKLLAYAGPIGQTAKDFPAAALRSDLGGLATIAPFLPQLLRLLPNGPRFQAPFSDLMKDAGVTNEFLQWWFDYICFVLQALPAKRHLAAPVSYMLSDLYEEGAYLDYPKKGMGALIEALERGVKKHGGCIRYGAHVKSILKNEDGNRAIGVSLKGGAEIFAKEAVVSNASAWDTEKLLSIDADMPSPLPKVREPAGSFMHVHLGLRADQLPKDIPLHFSVIRSFDEPIDAPGNVVIISVPSVVNPDLAPPNRHCLHAYVAATEPFDAWDGLVRGSPEYEAKKRERVEPLLEAVERAIPGARSAIDLELIGSPLTHARFTRRYQGTYGPVAPAGAEQLPGPSTSLDGLLCCGDSTFPGIGVPAVAASGCAAATKLMSVEEHLDMLEAMGLT